MSNLPKALAAGVLALAGLVAPAAAQCPMPDLLDGGPCCSIAQENLPFFDRWKQDSQQICWLDCDVDALIGLSARWSQLKPLNTGVHCGRYRARLRLYDSGGTIAWKGKILFTYSRTWFEDDGVSQRFQVWRFLINGNLKPADPTATPCPAPVCAAAFGNRVRFTGYVDYALDCNNGTWSHSWMATHACDSIDHAAGFPRAGGALHPDRSYTFVGPAAGFVAGPLQTAEGGSGGLEAVRRNIIPTPGQPDTFCQFEERIQFALDPTGQFCLCGPSTAPTQWQQSVLVLDGACGTGIKTPGGPFLPGFLSMGIGSWTDFTTYPGLEVVRFNAFNGDYFEPCTGTTKSEVFYGVTTIRGYPATEIINTGLGNPLPPTFIDQGNSIRLGNGVSTVMNIPYVSDHILNLNH